MQQTLGKILLVLDDIHHTHSDCCIVAEGRASNLDSGCLGAWPVVDEAIALARLHGAQLTALFVMDATWNVYVGHDWLSGSGSRADFLDYMKDQEDKSAQTVMRLFEQKSAGLSVKMLVAAGDVVEQIQAEMFTGYDMAVIPNPLRRGLEIMRDGVAKICHAAPCRILLVPCSQADSS